MKVEFILEQKFPESFTEEQISEWVEWFLSGGCKEPLGYNPLVQIEYEPTILDMIKRVSITQNEISMPQINLKLMRN